MGRHRRRYDLGCMRAFDPKLAGGSWQVLTGRILESSSSCVFTTNERAGQADRWRGAFKAARPTVFILEGFVRVSVASDACATCKA